MTQTVTGFNPTLPPQTVELSTPLSLTLASSTNSNDLTNPNCRGCVVIVDLTAGSGTSPTLTVTIKGKDPASGKYYTILASAALAVTSTTQLTVYPGIAVTSNVSASTVLPSQFRIEGAIGGSNTPLVTGTVSCVLIP